MLAAQIVLIALASALLGFGRFVLPHLPADTPGPFLVWLTWGLSIPLFLAAVALVLAIAEARKGAKRGYAGIALATLFISCAVGLLGYLVVFGVPAFLLGVAVTGLGFWIARRRNGASNESEGANPGIERASED